MKLIILILSAISLFVTPLQLSAQTKRALVIGLGEQEDKNWGKINGDKDISYVEAMLLGVGYKEITTLVNKQATKVRIVNEFQKLASRCRVGDIVYIHFSGHGQQVTDVDGDEEDGLDEAWIPYDAYLKYGENDRGEKHLIDDEINVLLTDIRKKIGEEGAMLVVVDACHSGDSSRGEDIGETVRGVSDRFVIPVSKRGYASKGIEQWLTISACKDYQQNQELKTPQVGKLTYALYSISQKREVTKRAIMWKMWRYRSAQPQTPVLTGDEIKNDLTKIL
jgi:hypothetical protein